MTMEFWFEFASTYSYPAAMRVEEAARAAGVAVSWRPFLLGPIFKSQGWNDSPFNVYPAKGAYMWRDMERLCAAQGIAFKRPSRFPRGSLAASRVVCLHATEEWVPEFVRRVYRANFAQDRDIASADELRAILSDVGAPPGLVEEAETPEGKGALRAQTERAQALGIFGAPSFVAGGELFWGGDRLDAAIEWARTKR